MKTENLNLVTLSQAELLSIDGGSGFFEDLFFAIGYAAHVVYEIGRAGGQFQQSLPSNLKK